MWSEQEPKNQRSHNWTLYIYTRVLLLSGCKQPLHPSHPATVTGDPAIHLGRVLTSSTVLTSWLYCVDRPSLYHVTQMPQLPKCYTHSFTAANIQFIIILIGYDGRHWIYIFRIYFIVDNLQQEIVGDAFPVKSFKGSLRWAFAFLAGDFCIGLPLSAEETKAEFFTPDSTTCQYVIRRETLFKTTQTSSRDTTY